jgi:predicted RNA-binding protein with RPS1 domain
LKRLKGLSDSSGEATSLSPTGRLVKTDSFKGKKPNVQSKISFSSNAEKSPAQKEKKVKKPKHLKRKLEQLSQDDEQTREIILKEMAQFEEIKSKLAKKSNKKRSKAGKEDNQHATKTSFAMDADLDPGTNSDIVKNALANRNMNNSYTDTTLVHNETAVANDETEDGNNNDEEEDSKMQNHEAPRRERGRRRRGRKDTAQQILETQFDHDSKQTDLLPLVRDTDNSQISITDELHQKKRTDQKRYCIGRKPVTDFVMGQKYAGKVVYVKDFGVFFDIGCHSDAFCHVSRLHDDFVKNPHEMFKEGDEREVRVVEIDRKQKRITVSLQSEERIADERASLEARAQRKKNRNESRRKSTNTKSIQEASHDNTSKVEDNVAADYVTQKVTVANGNKVLNALHSKDPKTPPQVPAKPSTSAGNTAAEEKRARKLARRAERRAQVA